VIIFIEAFTFGVKTMSSHRLLFLILSVLLFSSITNAQKAYKIGESFRVRSDTSENPAINIAVQEMKRIPKAKLAIISYGLPGLAIRRMNAVKLYYKQFYETDENNLLTIYGGYENLLTANSKLRAEFWIVPENADLPKIFPNYPKESYLFDEYWEKGESGYDYDFPFPPQIFAKVLKENAKSRGYIIFYGYQDEDIKISLKKAYRRALEAKQSIVKSSKLASSRIVILSGGYHKEWAHVELWIVPPAAVPPKPTLANKTASNK
jgi:hypothetical protein